MGSMVVKAGFAALALLASSGAFALACVKPGVEQIGTAGQIAAPEFAAGGQPASDAVAAILPTHWTLHQANRLSAPVSWTRGTAWIAILQSVAKQANVCVTVDWKQHAVALAPVPNSNIPAFDDELLLQPEKPKTAHKPTQSEPAVTAPATGPTSAIPVIVTSATPKVVATQPDTTPIAPLPTDLVAAFDTSTIMYTLHPNETLRGVLTRWSKDAGWTLIWETDVDYTIDASATFPIGTSYKEAVKETMHAFWERTRWLRATSYRNNVIVITGSNS
jgi:hypothetical protein